MADIINTDKPLYKQLTYEQVTPSSKQDVELTIIYTFLVVMLINFAALWYMEQYPGNRGYWLVKEKWNMLFALDKPVEWLILGDSSGNQGIVPNVLVGESGDSAINLTTVGDLTMANDIWMLQQYIETFGSPDQVLIVHVYDMWHRNVSPVLLATLPISRKDLGQLEPTLTLTSADESAILLTRYMPLLANNKTLSEIIFQGAFNPGLWFKKWYTLNPDGYMPDENPKPQMLSISQDTEIHQFFVSNRTFMMSDINKAALDRLTVLAEQYEMSVYIVNGPLYEGLASDVNFQLYYAEMQDAIQTYTDQSEYLYFLDTTAVFPADKMENADHIIGEGTIEYSKIIADAIKQLE